MKNRINSYDYPLPFAPSNPLVQLTQIRSFRHENPFPSHRTAPLPLAHVLATCFINRGLLYFGDRYAP